MNRSEVLPIGLALVSAVLWGVWWVPVRFLNAAGLEGAWAGVALSLSALPVICALMLTRKGAKFLPAKALIGSGLVAVAFILYTVALDYTDVVRVVLLFYLAPAWSTLIEWGFMNRRLTWQSALAFSCSLVGMLFILGGDLFVRTMGAGEGLAIISGLLWAVGAALLFASPTRDPVQVSLVAVALSAVVSILVCVADDVSEVKFAAFSEAMTDYPVYLIGCLYFAPMLAITIWSAGKLPPALMSYLLSVEIIAGVVSSVLLLNERFGAIELLGAIAIMLGATIELMLPRQSPQTKCLHEDRFSC